MPAFPEKCRPDYRYHFPFDNRSGQRLLSKHIELADVHIFFKSLLLVITTGKHRT